MNESILTSVKKLLGIVEDDENFDMDVMIHINTYLNHLNQIGVGVKGFTIQDKTAVWGDFLGDDVSRLQAVKTFVYIKVRLIFDPPTSSYVATELNNAVKEIEFRLNAEVDPGMQYLDNYTNNVG